MKFLKGIHFLDLLSNLHRNLGVIVMVPKHVVAFIAVLVTHVIKWASKSTTPPPRILLQALLQVRMMMKRNL